SSNSQQVLDAGREHPAPRGPPRSPQTNCARDFRFPPAAKKMPCPPEGSGTRHAKQLSENEFQMISPRPCNRLTRIHLPGLKICARFRFLDEQHRSAD